MTSKKHDFFWTCSDYFVCGFVLAALSSWFIQGHPFNLMFWILISCFSLMSIETAFRSRSLLKKIKSYDRMNKLLLDRAANDPHMKTCKIVWGIGDIQSLRPSWTEEQAQTWLEDNYKVIQDSSVEHGWMVIEGLLPPEDV